MSSMSNTTLTSSFSGKSPNTKTLTPLQLDRSQFRQTKTLCHGVDLKIWAIASHAGHRARVLRGGTSQWEYRRTRQWTRTEWLTQGLMLTQSGKSNRFLSHKGLTNIIKVNSSRYFLMICSQITTRTSHYGSQREEAKPVYSWVTTTSHRVSGPGRQSRSVGLKIWGTATTASYSRSERTGKKNETRTRTKFLLTK